MPASDKPHPPGRRSQGEEYPGRGDADSLEEHYGASGDPEPDEDEGKGERKEDEPG
jgi:hypothetical protein